MYLHDTYPLILISLFSLSNSPYFDNVNAIIFLAPISCFDETLAEDRFINRLQDSFMLFQAICQAKCLSRASLILFLNKCDLLEKKLGKGVMVNKYIPSFGDRSNDAPTVIKCTSSSFLYGKEAGLRKGFDTQIWDRNLKILRASIRGRCIFSLHLLSYVFFHPSLFL